MCASGKCFPMWNTEGVPSYRCECYPGYEGDACNISTYIYYVYV